MQSTNEEWQMKKEDKMNPKQKQIQKTQKHKKRKKWEMGRKKNS
jgi:hypothetical protein